MDAAPSPTRALAGAAGVVLGVGATFGTIIAAWVLSYVAADHDAVASDYMGGAGVLRAALGLWVSSALLWRHARRL